MNQFANWGFEANVSGRRYTIAILMQALHEMFDSVPIFQAAFFVTWGFRAGAGENQFTIAILMQPLHENCDSVPLACSKCTMVNLGRSAGRALCGPGRGTGRAQGILDGAKHDVEPRARGGPERDARCEPGSCAGRALCGPGRWTGPNTMANRGRSAGRARCKLRRRAGTSAVPNRARGRTGDGRGRARGLPKRSTESGAGGA